MTLLLLIKAAIRGGAASDLFATPVDVQGYTTEAGTYVAPHRSTRHKRHKDPPAERPHAAPPAPAQADLFSAPAPAPPAAPQSDLFGFTPPEKPAPKRKEPVFAPTPEPTPPPPPLPPKPADTRPPARQSLDRFREKINQLGAMLDKRWRSIEGQAEGRARAKEPGRGAHFGRAATTWTTRQEDWYQDALRALLEPQAAELRGALAHYDKAVAKQDAEAARLGLNEPWAPRHTPDELRALLDNDQGPVRLSATKGSKRDRMEAAAAPRPAPPVEPGAPLEWGVKAGTSKKERRDANKRAIGLLADKPDAADMTPADRQALARYTGNGGSGDSLNEFYTPPEVASAVWDMLRSAGFTGGTVLEPSCGTGVFLHTAPPDAKITGVELEGPSSRIAQILHGPAGHEVLCSSLERFATQDGRKFAAVIGNPPYCIRGALVKDDKRDIGRAEQYFVDTGLDKLEDGGLLAYVLPTSIMDSAGARAFRQLMLTKAEFLGGARMPNTAFEASHTAVTTDVLIMRKRPQEVAGALGTLNPDQLQALGVWDEDFLSGRYFTEGRGREHVLGTLGTKMGQFGEELTVNGSMHGVPEALSGWNPEPPDTPGPDMPAIMAALGEDLAARRRAAAGALKEPYQTASAGDVRTIDGIRYILQGEPPRWERTAEEVPEAAEAAQRIGEWLDDLDSGRARDPAMTRAGLIEDLDAFVAAHGLPHRNKELRKWLASPHLPATPGAHPEDHAHAVRQAAQRAARVLGAVNEDGSYSALVTGETRHQDQAGLDVVGAKLAGEAGGFTPDQLAAAAGAHVDSVLDYLHASSDFALEADGRTWTTMDGYLSGELWPKLDAAKQAAEDSAVAPELRAKYAKQALRLEELIDPQSLEDVEVTLNSGFLQPEDLEAFFADRRADYLERNPNAQWTPDVWKVRYEPGLWHIENAKGNSPHYGEAELALRFLNRTGVRKDEKEELDKLNRDFKGWLLGSDRRDAVEQRYNRLYRGFRQREFSNAPMHIPGMVTEGLKEFQYGGVRWALAAGKGIIAADVGLGKTVRGLMLAKVAKMTGQSKKPVFVVPKSVVANWQAEAEKWFPGSKILTIGETYSTGKDGKVRAKADNAEVRRQKLHQLQQNDFDFVFISQPAWNDLDVSPELKDEYERDDFWEQRGEALQGAKDKKAKRIKEAWDQASAQREFVKEREDTIYFDKLGVDMILADEAHAYKNLYAVKNRFGQSPKFLGGGGLSKRSKDTNHKARALRDANGGKGVYFLTATPTKNSPLEVYSMLSHIAPEAFERMGIKNSEEFLDRFCTFELRHGLNLAGKFEEQLQTTGFKNLDELREVMKRYIDRKTAADVGLALPERNDHEHLFDMTPDQEAKYHELRELCDPNKKQQDGTGDAHVFSVMDKMGKTSLDPALVGVGGRSPKLDLAAKNIAKLAANGGQIAFVEALEVHPKLADMLVAQGIPRERIAILNGDTAPNSADRQKVSDAFNAGLLDVVIANKIAEEGVNLQKRTADIHHLDIPWEPATLQQRNGRGLRQGNTLKGVGIHTYLARGSFDAYRWQTVMAKRDWQDLLWNGGNEVENLAMANVSREDWLIMMAADPDAARKQYAEDKAKAQEKQQAEGQGKAAERFVKFQEMTANLAKLKAKGATGASVKRLEHHAHNLRETLAGDRFFTHKGMLDRTDRVYLEPTTNTAWAAGQGFELAGGKEGPVNWSSEPSRWVVDSVGEDDKGAPQIVAHLYGKPSTSLEMPAERFKEGVTPMPYDAAEEQAHMEAEATKRAEEKANAIDNFADLADMPAAVLEARAPEIQRKLKDSVAHYRNNKDGYQANYGWVDASGTPVMVPYYDQRKLADTHDLILPTSAGREKAIEGYVATAEGRRIKDRQLHTGRGRGRNRGYSSDNGIEAHHAEGSYTESATNPWAGFLDKHFPGAAAEARKAVRSRALERIAGATNLRDALAAAQPTVDVAPHGTRIQPDAWPREVVQALRDKARELGVEHMPLRMTAPQESSWGPQAVHHGMFRMAHNDGPARTTSSYYSGTSTYQPTVGSDASWPAEKLFNRLLGEEYVPPAPPAAPEAPPAPPAPAPAPAPEPEPEPAAPPAPAPAPAEKPELVEHLTGRGKLLRGIVRKDLDYHAAKQIDRFTFRKNGGYFIREKHLEAA